MSELRVPEPVAMAATRVATDVGDLWLSSEDDVIRPYLQATGSWEPDEGRLLKSLFHPHTRFLDVGANIGYFSAMAALLAPGGTIDSIEPDPANLSLLRLNLFARAPHATIWPCALGRTREVVGLTANARNRGDTRTAIEQSQATMVAAVVPGDSLFKARRFDVFKVDVQGFEVEVLEGLQGVAAHSKGATWVVEFFPDAIVSRGNRPLDVLRSYRQMHFEFTVSLQGRLERMSDEAIVGICERAGTNGFVNLVMRRES